MRGDFGVSLRTKRPVTELVSDRLWNSLKLASVAMLITICISLPLGVVAAVYRGRVWDRVAMVVALLGQSLPSFWTGIVFILIFSVTLGWLPTSGMGSWQHYILPAVAMGWSTSAGVVRLLRSSTLEVLDTEYIKLARLKGLREFIVVSKHAVRNALIPVITFIGFMYGVVIAAAITTEVVFTWPGLGRLAYEAVLWRDFPLLQLTVLTWATFIVAINFAVDLVYVVLDPGLGYSHGHDTAEPSSCHGQQRLGQASGRTEARAEAADSYRLAERTRGELRPGDCPSQCNRLRSPCARHCPGLYRRGQQ